MKSSTTLALFASLIFGGIFLSLGVLQTGKGWGLLAVLALAIGWAVFLRFRRPWLSPILLVSYLAAASFAILAGASPYGLVAGSACTLFAWEASGEYPTLSDPLAHPMTALFRQQHLRLLALAIGLGLALAEALLFVRLSIPFAALFFAALLVLFSLFRFFRLIRGR